MALKEFSGDSVVNRSKDQVSSRMDSEIVLMNIENGEYYKTGAVGGRIWELVEGGITVADLCKRLIDEFDVGKEQCRKDVQNFLMELHKNGLIKIESQ